MNILMKRLLASAALSIVTLAAGAQPVEIEGVKLDARKRCASPHPASRRHVVQVLGDRARAGAQDVADVAVGLALDHPVQHLGLARGQPAGQGTPPRRPRRRRSRASRPAIRRRRRLVQRLLGHHRCSVKVMRRAPRATVRLTGRRRRGGAGFRAPPRRSPRAASPSRRRRSVRQQLARQRGLPDAAAVAFAHHQRGVAEGVQRVARLALRARGLQVRADAPAPRAA
jgi:hypothetical protein